MGSSASAASRVRQAAGSLNFFRLHLLIGLFLPLVIAGILYGSNGENHIRYVDLLFSKPELLGISELRLMRYAL
jgi:hypothetical protein